MKTLHTLHPRHLQIALCCVLLFKMARGCADDTPLWQIGTPDGVAGEFALTPDQWSRYDEDARFIIGSSDPARDWPYVLPGPHDSWGGKKSHSPTIVFSLDKISTQGTANLRLDLVDTRPNSAPVLRVRVNGYQSDWKTGGGGTNLYPLGGKSDTARPSHIDVPIPVSQLVKGLNVIEITSTWGCWLVWDALSLRVPPGTILNPKSEGVGVREILPIRALVERDGKTWQPIEVGLLRAGPKAQTVTLRCDSASTTVEVSAAQATGRLLLPAVESERDCKLTVESGGAISDFAVRLKPVRRLTIYVLNHSHTDIGYTDLQPKIEEKQVNNLLKGIALAKETAGNRPGERFVWNVEVLWAADLYERRLSAEQRRLFDDAVKQGQVSLNGLYLNLLTPLCRPEELLRSCRYAAELGQRLGVKVDSAMISDLPGSTWGTVNAFAQAGIRYYSQGYNIGDVMAQWTNKPFWWVSQSGRERVLVWAPSYGYALSHIIRKLSPEFIDKYQNANPLPDDAAFFADYAAGKPNYNLGSYPYDIAYIRWSGHTDNDEPDGSVVDFVKQWNATYAWPRFVISSTSEAFAAFEKKYGDKLPVMRGDWTPYWENGAGSSAAETALNRASSDRVAQAQTLFALRRPQAYPAAAFTDAWNDVMLYSEHTWGAAGSVSSPEDAQTTGQWAIKREYALEADRRSRELLNQALIGGKVIAAAFDIYNTCSWPRTELVTLDAGQSRAGDRVLDERGAPVPSQRLSTGELCFLARDVQPFASRRFRVVAGKPQPPEAAVTVGDHALGNGLVNVGLDPASGAIAEMTGRDVPGGNLVDRRKGPGLNDYLYLLGSDNKDNQRAGPARISVREHGPLVAELEAESTAPGCRNLKRRVRVIAGQDRVELTDILDKERAPKTPGSGHYGIAVENVNLAFPLAVPDGQTYLDVPFGVVRPDNDQIPTSCKDWFTVGPLG